MEPNTPPKFQSQPLDQETAHFLELSSEECAELTEREIRCPYCHYRIGKVFSDSTGHLRVKCQKCKAESILNLAYFRRQKGFRFFRQKYLTK